MRVKILVNKPPLRFGDVGYCSMVPVDLYAYGVEFFYVRVNNIAYRLKVFEFEIIGEDDNPFEAHINLKEQAAFTEHKIEITDILKESTCTIFHFVENELRRCMIFDKNGDLVEMDYIERRMLAKFIYDYCSDCKLPYVEEMLHEEKSICNFKYLKNFKGSQSIPKGEVRDFLEKIVRKESSNES